MATTRDIVLRGPKAWPRTDMNALAERTSRRVDRSGCRWTVALFHDGRQMTGRVTNVEPLVRCDEWEIPAVSEGEKREIVVQALESL